MKSQFSRIVRGCVLIAGGVALFAATSSPAAAQSAGQCTLTVKITAIHNTDGNILLTLHKDQNTVVQTKAVEIDAKTMTAQAVFTGLAQGTYGVSVIHDENKNSKLDFNEMGMPLEGYGHSNNPAKRMGPPNFDETKFALTPSGATIQIELIYWP